jgi:phage/plasmid-associated DNA primase
MTNQSVNKDIENLKKTVHAEYSEEENNDNEQYFPGAIRIVNELSKEHRFRTIPEIGSDREEIFYFNGQIYERAEEFIKSESHVEFIKQWKDMLKVATDKVLISRLQNSLNSGPTINQINEVLSMIRRTTFTTDIMNPPTHIPFMNGLLNLSTRKLEPFTPDLFYTYQISANFITDRYITLRDAPLFSYLLNTAYYEKDIPMILSYFGYSFHPELPVHKVLFIVGRQRIGKGTTVRIPQGLMQKGSGSISLARILTAERFQFSGIRGKNLLIDSEVKRTFRRGIPLDWAQFCNLFGSDNLNLELKGREVDGYISKAKGIFLGNLPFIHVDSPAAVSRILLVGTRDEKPKRVIPDLDKKILANERDEIATLLMQVLFKLMDREYNFPGQKSDESTVETLESFADPVAFFVEDETEYVEGSNVLVEDVYKRFAEWSKGKGITLLPRQTFVRNFGRIYPKKKLGPRNKRDYFFINCQLNEDIGREKNENKKQVGHGLDLSETLKFGVREELGECVQHAYNTPRVARNGNDIHVKDTAQKLDTKLNSSANPENLGIEQNTPVSNLLLTSNSRTSKTGSETDKKPSNSNVQKQNTAHEENNLSQEPLHGLPLTKLQGDESVRMVLKQGVHLNAADTGVSIYGDKFNIAVTGTYYRQNTETVDRIMEDLGFKKGNTGSLGNVFFSRPLKGGDQK